MIFADAKKSYEEFMCAKIETMRNDVNNRVQRLKAELDSINEDINNQLTDYKQKAFE